MYEKDEVNGERLECTAAHPYTLVGAGRGRWAHPDAVEVGEQCDGYPSGDVVTYACPHCGVRFEAELPQ